MPHTTGEWIAIVSFGLLMLANVYALFRLAYLFKEFPPHRHVRFHGQSVIVYPRGMAPSPQETTNGEEKH